MYCDEIIALDFSNFMIHEAQVGHFGTMANVSRDVKNTEQRNKRLIEESYGGFLTPDEIEDVLRGVEIYLPDEEIRERAPLRKAWRDAFLLKKHQEQQALLEAAMEGQMCHEECSDVPQEVEEITVEKPKARKTRGNK